MSSHLCLKWNNHAPAFLKSISHVQTKEKYCDATIACQGKYFPVHRLVLSTCSDYFDDIFERIQCQHPYIIFKDIEPKEMELLLNYMYKGEVNVIQEMLPSLIKAAEALRIKGLAVPDDSVPSKESTSKKRTNSSNDNPLPKRKSEEGGRRKGRNSELNPQADNQHTNKDDNSFSENLEKTESMEIKEEPPDTADYVPSLPSPVFCDEMAASENDISPSSKEMEKNLIAFPMAGSEPPIMKTEETLMLNDLPDEQSANWNDCASGSTSSNFLPPETTEPDYRHHFNIDSRHREGRIEDTAAFSHHLQLASNPYLNSPLCGAGKDTSSKDGPFKCSLCSFRCRLKRNLGLHMRIHTGEKPFKCPVCYMKFRQKSHLNTHLKKKFRCGTKSGNL